MEWIKEKLLEAGNTIGSVHFIKRSNSQLRKMSYRLHVKNPSIPFKKKKNTRIIKQNKREIDIKNNQLTVYDANKVIRDSRGKKIGRGAWRTISLEKVIRIKNKGTTYLIKQY